MLIVTLIILVFVVCCIRISLCKTPFFSVYIYIHVYISQFLKLRCLHNIKAVDFNQNTRLY